MFSSSWAKNLLPKVFLAFSFFGSFFPSLSISIAGLRANCDETDTRKEIRKKWKGVQKMFLDVNTFECFFKFCGAVVSTMSCQLNGPLSNLAAGSRLTGKDAN